MENQQQGAPVPVTPTPTPSAGGAVAVGSNALYLGIGALAVVGAIAIGGYYYFWGGTPSPEEVIRRSIDATVNAKSSHQTADIVATIKVPNALLGATGGFIPPTANTTDGTMSFGIRIKSSGASDSSHPDAEVASGSGELTFEVSGGAYTIDLDARVQNETVYLRFNKVPLLEMFGLQHLIGQWMTIDLAKLSAQSGISSDAYKQQKEAGKKLNAELAEAEKTHFFYVVKEVLPNESLGGVQTYHYRFELNQEALRKYIRAASELVIAHTYRDDAEKRTSTLADLNGFYDKRLDTFSVGGSGELWIGKRDMHLYKMTFTPVLQPFEVEPGQRVEVSGSVALEAKDYDKPVSVEIPEGARPLEEVLGPLLGGAGGMLQQ